MAILTFYKENQELIKYVLRQDHTSVGRSSGSDICLPDTNISRTHFTVSFSNGRFLIVDRSTNGTKVNGSAVVSQELKDDDQIEIGDWRIQFVVSPETETRQITLNEGRDPTEVLSYAPESGELRYRSAYIKTVGKRGASFRIVKDVVAIGKAKANDICLSDDSFASSYHCKIENRRGRFFLKDLKSTNGTFLNTQQVIETAIPDEATIKVGNTELRFSRKEEVQTIKPSKVHEFEGMIGSSQPMRQLFALIEKIAKSDATALIQGESGVGKELVARAIHNSSARADRKLVALNCSAIAKDLIESELFGHERGAFTSAHQKRRGAFEEANGGTIFLDEIGDMPQELQPKLLRVLENREIKRVGSNALIDVDMRVVAASNQNLAALVKRGLFREDLFHRLYVIPISIPPLRERVDDIETLAEHFLQQARGKKKKPRGFSASALEAMQAYDWPGNVRELKNVIDRACLNAEGELIEALDISFSPTELKQKTVFEQKASDAGAVKTLKDYERERILEELVKNNWNKKKTAEVLGIAKTTLFEKIKKYQLKP